MYQSNFQSGPTRKCFGLNIRRHSGIGTAAFFILAGLLNADAVNSQTVTQDNSNVAGRKKLEYKWKTGDQFHYKIAITTEFGGVQRTIDAQCVYTVGAESLSGYGKEDSNGTAFVVSSDGYLMTCAHVVEDANKVEVTVGGRTYDATVVEANHVQDLALLKIQAENLKALPFSDSATVQQGQDIRAVGFPLANLLGKEFKVTKGSIAGFIPEEDGRRRIQIDASINPGNSGGPVINDFGNVVGVTSSKLMGMEVTSVGFAVPADLAREMLARNKVPNLAAKLNKQLVGPKLVEAIESSIAFVKVEGSSSQSRFTVNYTSSYNDDVPITTVPFMANSPFDIRGIQTRSTTVSASGSFVVDQFGEVTKFQGLEQQFPFAIGPVGMLCLEDLNHRESQQWGTEKQSELKVIEQERQVASPFQQMLYPSLARSGFSPYGYIPFSRFGSGFPLGRYSGLPQSRNVEKVKATYPAVERTLYQLVSETEAAVFLKKNYEYRTLKNKEKPHLLIKGIGEIKFDKTQHMPGSLVYNATVTLIDGSQKVSLPIKVTYVLRDPAEVKAERELAAERMAKAREEARVAATVPNPEKVDSLLKILGEADGRVSVISPMLELSKIAVVEEKRKDVVKAIETVLKNGNDSTARLAIDTLQKWGTNEEKIRVVLSYLKNSSGDYSYHAIEALALMPALDAHRAEVTALGQKILTKGGNSLVVRNAKMLLSKWASSEDQIRVLMDSLKNKTKISYTDIQELTKIAVVDERRDEVSRFGEEMLRKYADDNIVKDQLSSMLLKWATKENQARIFATFLANPSNKFGYSDHAKVFAAMGESTNPDVHKVLISRLLSRADAGVAANALIKVGPPCEELLIKAFRKEPRVREASLAVFRQIGSAKCIPLLERLELDTDNQFERNKIHEARKVVLARIGPSAMDGKSGEANPFGSVEGLFDDK